MPDSLSRRRLLAFSSGAVFSVLASACSTSQVTSQPSPKALTPAEMVSSSAPNQQVKVRSIRRADPLPDSAMDGHGPVILPDDFFVQEGTFSTGTLSHRALNVPRPLFPPEAGERTVEGLHAFLQYWSAAQDFMFLTGDTEPFLNLPGQDRFRHMTDMYRDIYRYEIGWLVSRNNHPLCINLSAAQPTPSSVQDVYCWKATLRVDDSAFLFNHETLQRELLTNMYGRNSQADAYVYFGEQGWQMLEDPQASPSATASPSPSATHAQPTPSVRPSPNVQPTSGAEGEQPTPSAKPLRRLQGAS